MNAPGPLLASGRDADIFEYGPGLVLRRARARRSMAHEARTMEYLHLQGYPVPRVDAISDDGYDLVMERVEGPSMVESLARAPWTVRRQARVLAALHRQLHEISAPEFLPPAPVGQGDRVLHMDLHPLNVIIGRRGPVVIDWTNAGRGAPAVDVGLAWVLMSAGEIPESPVMSKVLGWGRSLLTNGFITNFDRAEVVGHLRTIVDWKVRDPHMSVHEIEAMWRLVERTEART
jgi:aminoglycoside phosphotransferase (APT) family kinase protein